MVRNEDAWFSKQVATFGCPSPRAFSQIASGALASSNSLGQPPLRSLSSRAGWFFRLKSSSMLRFVYMQGAFRFETIDLDPHSIMATLILRRIASRGLFLTSLVFVVVVSVAAPLPLLAQGTQSQDLGPTNASQTVTASLVLKVHHPDYSRTM